MGRGGFIYLSYTAVVLLSAVSSATAGLWDVDIDLDPAPSPEKGPPFSAHASRDRSLLPYQIIGVVAAYLGSVLILGTLLLTVGRQARKRAQNMAEQPTEMVKPTARTFDLSPLQQKGPFTRFATKSKRSLTSNSIRSGHGHKMGSPGTESIVSFDPHVLQKTDQMNMDGMDDFYSALNEQEEHRMQQSVSSEHIQPASPQFARNKPPLTLNPYLQHMQNSGPQSPLSPDSTRSQVHAIYPPSTEYPMGGPASPTAQPQSPLKETWRARTSSIGSGRTVGSDNSSRPKKLQKSIRDRLENIRISGPLQGKLDNDDDARTPLSPKSFTDNRAAPAPPSARTADSHLTPTTPGTGGSAPYPYTQENDPIGEARNMPLPNPQRANNPYINEAQALTDVASTRRDPPGLTLQTKRSNISAANSQGTLPFRQKQYQTPTTPSQHTYASDWNARTAGLSSPGLKSPEIRQNVVEVGNSHKLGGKLTGGLTTPRTPWDNTMSLATPVTPHLMSREERKQRRKEEKAAKGVITEEDQVADEKDLWSSGY